MQLVIEISDGLYNNLDEIKNGSIASKIILNCVRKGQVLPKGHGRLIDADALEDTMQTREELIDEEWAVQESSVVKAILNTFAPTIIEADKEDE